MVQHKIGSLPVVDASGELIGIFTERDVLIGECGDTKAVSIASSSKRS